MAFWTRYETLLWGTHLIGRLYTQHGARLVAADEIINYLSFYSRHCGSPEATRGSVLCAYVISLYRVYS